MPRIFFFLTCLITEPFTMISILEFFCFCFQIEWPVFLFVCLFFFLSVYVYLQGSTYRSWFVIYNKFWVSTTEFFVIINLFTTKGKLIVKYEWIYIGEIWSKWICNYHYLQTLSTMTVFIMSRTHFRMNPHSIFAWMSRNSLLKAGAKFEVFTDCNWNRTHNHLVHKQTFNHSTMNYVDFVLLLFYFDTFCVA